MEFINTPEQQELLRGSALAYLAFKEKFSPSIIGKEYVVDDLNKPNMGTITSFEVVVGLLGKGESPINNITDFDAFDVERSVVNVKAYFYFKNDSWRNRLYFERFITFNYRAGLS